MPSLHAKLFQPSKMERVMLCPASVSVEVDCPEEESVYAQEGTRAHALAEYRLRRDLGFEETEPTESAEMSGFVDAYVNYVRKLRKQTASGMLMVEVRLPIDWLTGEEGGIGTADAVLLDGSTLHVIDLKYGQGVRVDAEGNPQLLTYAAAAVRYLEGLFDARIETVVTHICQPRVSNGFTHATITRTELDAFAEKVKAVVAKARAQFDLPIEKREFHAGEKQCKFCKYRTQCRALADFSAKAIGMTLEDLSGQRQSSGALTPAEIGGIWQKLSTVKVFIEAIDAQTYALLAEGKEVPGVKLVLGSPGRAKWIDEQAADAWLARCHVSASDRRVVKLITPTQARKLMPKDAWEKLSQKYVMRAEPKPVIALQTDPREPVCPANSQIQLEKIKL